MLRGREIQAIAGKAQIRDTQIEKDYVLTWLLWGIAQSELLYKSLIFKGGTVLKKAYFPDYRFSEDLDFTLINAALTDMQIIEAFQVEFAEKAHHKGHKADSFLPTWQRKTKQFENLWNQYLAHQIANLPKFEGVCRALNRHFKVLM